jgi:hypothetical protein
MTPISLYTLLGLGVIAVVALVTIVVAAQRIPRIWKAAAQARPGPALTWLTTTGLLVYVLGRLTFDPTPPVNLFAPITCSRFCGWEFYYVIVIGALRLLAVADIVVASGVTLALMFFVRAWLDKPVEPECEGVTNGVRLRRQWRLWRLERDAIRSLTAKVRGAGADSSVLGMRESTLLEPASAVTSIRFDPVPEGFDDLAAALTSHPLIESVDINPDGNLDGGQLRVHWDLAKVDYLPVYRVLRAGSIAPAGY